MAIGIAIGERTVVSSGERMRATSVEGSSMAYGPPAWKIRVKKAKVIINPSPAPKRV